MQRFESSLIRDSASGSSATEADRFCRLACRLVLAWSLTGSQTVWAVQPLSTTSHSIPSAVPAATAVEDNGLIASLEPGWPQWRGPRRDGVSDEVGLQNSWPEGGPRLLWRADGIGTGWSSPIIVGEQVYVTGDVGDDLVVWAFDRKGQPKWKATNGRAWTGPYPGARASCVYSSGRLYHMNAHGRLACLHAASGKEQWSLNILQRFGAKEITWGLSECLLVDGPHVIVTPVGRDALMAALDKVQGNTVWTTPRLAEDKPSYSSPILFKLGDRRLIANCSSAHGFAVDADRGELLVTVPLKNRFGVNASTPIFGRDSLYFVTPYTENGRSYHLSVAEDGVKAQLAWQSMLDTVTGAGVLVGETLYTAGYRRAKRWFGLDWRSGKTRRESNELTTGAAIWAEGRLYCLDEQGKVGLFKPGGESLELVGQFQLVADRVSDAWAHPVLQDGQLYLRYHDTLFCYDVRATRAGD